MPLSRRRRLSFAAERNMSSAAMRGTATLPESKSPSRVKGSCRNLGGPASGGQHREGEEPKPMMHGRGKSDEAIAAMKPANKAERSAAELVEPRAKAKGNAGQHGTYRAQNRARVSHALVRIRRRSPLDPRWEPYAGKPHVRICAGGAQ